ncbi:dromaiocalcin-1-like isoform X1 [Pelodiscus sinensis]|uniref:dromaiocalcin-1-like isoform X1 n=1 Tax=Pelodiscus sinensis TaxID=13735 RepID=UPI003F6A9861
MGPVAFVTLCLLGCLVCSPALAGTQAGSCPQGWKSHQGNCYGYFTEAKSWKEAQAACRQYWQGANLVSILNKEENDMLAGYVKQHKEKSKHVWIGLSDPSEAGWVLPWGPWLRARRWDHGAHGVSASVPAGSVLGMDRSVPVQLPSVGHGRQPTGQSQKTRALCGVKRVRV